MTTQLVPRSVDQAFTETVQKRFFLGEDDVLLNPNLTPILTMVTKIGNRRRPATSTRVEWIEDDYVGVWGQANSSGDYNSVSTNIVVVDSTLFSPNDLVAVAKVSSSSAAEEVMRVTASAGNSLTVTRGIGGSGSDTIPATGDLRILGSAYAEGDSFGTPRSTTKAVKISYTQIFRRPIQITKSMVAQSQFGPANERQFQRRKALEEQRRAIESAGLWGRASETLALGAPGTIRTTMGFKSVVTNTYNANTTLTEGGMLSFSQTAFNKYYSGNVKLLAASAGVISALDFFSLGHLRTSPTDKVLGVDVQRYISSHGQFLVVRDLNIEYGPASGSTGWGDEAYAIDVDSVQFAPLSGNGENRDTQLLENVKRDGTDYYSDEYLTEGGWVIRFASSRHARLYNASAYA